MMQAGCKPYVVRAKALHSDASISTNTSPSARDRASDSVSTRGRTSSSDSTWKQGINHTVFE